MCIGMYPGIFIHVYKKSSIERYILLGIKKKKNGNRNAVARDNLLASAHMSFAHQSTEIAHGDLPFREIYETPPHVCFVGPCCVEAAQEAVCSVAIATRAGKIAWAKVI